MPRTEKASRRSVAILYSYPLFGKGIAQLLEASGMGLDITCINASLPNIQECLIRLKPDVVITESVTDGDVLRQLIRELPPFLYVGVRLGDDVMDVYRDRQVLTARPEELVGAIREGLTRLPAHGGPAG